MAIIQWLQLMNLLHAFSSISETEELAEIVWVTVDGVESSPLPVLSGVPQGSVLGPLLFLIYINDLPTIVCDTLSHLNMFADDILLYQVITCATDYALLQEVIHCIERWSSENYLNLNISKCKCMIVLCKQSPPLPEISLQLFGSSYSGES